jgi:hypothetical protein
MNLDIEVIMDLREKLGGCGVWSPAEIFRSL